MKFYTVTAVRQETVETTVHTDFAAAVSRINGLLRTDCRLRDSLKADVKKVFGADISVDTIGPYLQLLSEYGTPSEGFMFKNYVCEEDQSYCFLINCTAHELQFSNPAG